MDCFGEEEEEHLLNLSKICRLCGGKSVIGPRGRIPKEAKFFKAAFEVIVRFISFTEMETKFLIFASTLVI